MRTTHQIKLRKPLLLLLLGLFATGCIQNDVPYEIVRGDFTEMEIRGAQSLTIDKAKQTIDLVLSDTVDLRRVYLRDFHVTSDARIINDVTGQQLDTLDSYYLDLTQGQARYAIPEDKPYTFTVVTYQDYVWTLKATQNIKRVFTLENPQIGEAEFSITNQNTVTAYVPMDVELDNITIKELKLGPSNATMAWVKADGTVVENVDLKTIHNFEIPQHFRVRFFDITQDWIVSVEQSTQYVTNLVVNPWAKFAYLSAQGLVSAGAPGFQIRKLGEGDNAWTSVPDVKVEGTAFSAVAKGLTPGTKYEVRGMVGTNYGDVAPLTSEDAVEVPNLNFDTWSQKGKNWFPNADAANSYWATGNAGVTIYATANSVPVEGPGNAVAGKAARLETLGPKVPLVQIAAGNLFTGTYETNMGNPAKSATMGRAYAGRPTRMKGWYKYTPQVVTNGGNSYSAVQHPDAVGKADFCSIYIRLENWGGATVRPADVKKIADAVLETDQIVAAYTEFDLKLEYYDLVTKPDHIVIVSSSSRYGEDFCGGPGSLLYVDEFSLSFDYN